MSKITVPQGWNRQACIAWEENKKQVAINHVLADLNAQKEKSPRLTLQLAYYLFLIGDFRAAAKFLLLQTQYTPDHFEVLLNLAVCYSRSQQHQEAVTYAKKVLTLDPNSYVAYDVLASCFHQLDQLREAALSGTQSLEIKNKTASPVSKHPFKLPMALPSALAQGKKKIISFSLWGNQPRYLRGALHNLLLQKEIYPDWLCRFYVDQTVPADVLAALRDLGAQLIDSKATSLGEKLCWRFQVANDPEVGYFAVRDVDSVISSREAQAVGQWIQSETFFHVMRDWWTHTDLILAGMWGGLANVLPNMKDLYRGYASKHAPTQNIDQWFLRDCAWSMVRTSCLIHDRCFSSQNSRPFDGLPPKDRHIGQNEFAVRSQEQSEFLQAWVPKIKSLAGMSS
jgi:tetratricopeptide (TPR) repeat protein